MYALTQIAIGLVIAHVLWALFYLTGSIIWGRERAADSSSGRAMLLLVIATASGLAIYGFEGIALGLAGLMTPIGWCIATGLNGVLLAWLTPEEQRAHWWRTRLIVARNAFVGPGILPYFAMLVFCAHAALPDYSDDGVSYHLAYAYEWYRTGRIFVDHHFRFPYYTFNTEVIYAWLFVLRIGRYIPFLNWMTGTNAVLAIYGLIATIDETRQGSRTLPAQGAARVVYAIVPLSLVFAAVFFRWVDTAMPDATSSMCFTAAAAAIVLAIFGVATEILVGVALSIAFLAGMKPTYVALLPLFGLFVAMVGIRSHWGVKRITACLALMCALSSPWYIRNLIGDGDPLPPFLHMALGRTDPDMSLDDVRAFEQDLRPNTLSLRWIETYPLRLFIRPEGIDFREYGVTAVVLSLYVIPIAAVIFLFKTRRSDDDDALSALLWITLGGCLYLFVTSPLARYGLLLYPVLAASTGSLILCWSSLFRYGILAAPVVAALTVAPSLFARDFVNQFSDLAYNGIVAKMPSDQIALERQIAGYLEAEPLMTSKPWSHSGPNVLLVNTDIQYYIESYGGEPIGDWFGRDRYSGFISAVDDQHAVAYLDAHRVSAIVVRREDGAFTDPEIQSLRDQVVRRGFTELASSDDSYAVFARKSSQ